MLLSSCSCFFKQNVMLCWNEIEKSWNCLTPDDNIKDWFKEWFRSMLFIKFVFFKFVRSNVKESAGN